MSKQIFEPEGTEEEKTGNKKDPEITNLDKEVAILERKQRIEFLNRNIKDVQELDKRLADAAQADKKAAEILSSAQIKASSIIRQVESRDNASKQREMIINEREARQSEIINFIKRYYPLYKELKTIIGEICHRVKENSINFGGSLDGKEITDRAYFFWKERYDQLLKLSNKLGIPLVRPIEERKYTGDDIDKYLNEPIPKFEDFMGED